jgi:hypothetical protein
MSTFSVSLTDSFTKPAQHAAEHCLDIHLAEDPASDIEDLAE